MRPPFRPRLCVVLLILVAFPASVRALGPEDLALVVNKNAPNGAKLAEVYAAARGVPAGRTVVLDVPNAEEIDFDAYERDVVPPVRQFLRDNHLDTRVTCLVTFYGVPFRIRAKVDTDAEKLELADLQAQLAKVIDDVSPSVADAETLAKSLDPSFTPAPVRAGQGDVEELSRRASAALVSAERGVNAVAAPDAKKRATAQLVPLIEKLGGDGEVLARLGPAQLASQTQSPEQRRQWEALRDRVTRAAARVRELEERRFDADARAQVRQITASDFGSLNLARVLQFQVDYLKPGVTNAALDSELALLWWDYYPRSGPQINALNYKAAGQIHGPPVVMVSRLDGPDEKSVEDLIHTSVAVEKEGLRGCVAVNSFGFPNHQAAGGRNLYREFDQKFRGLGRLVRDKTGLELHEEYQRLFHRREVKGTAVYCGWYSLRDYVAGMEFNPGAVGYHVASLEMVGLHDDHETGWVHGLMGDGVVATLGPVAEPYLWAFPSPEEFFPLLFTGKLTLAEVYWKTEPAVSWMMCLVGDPLYTPYKADPALKPEDLPADLRAALAGPGEGSSPPKE